MDVVHFYIFCPIKKVVIVRYLPRKRGKYLNDDDGLRKGTLLHQLTYPNALRLTEITGRCAQGLR